MSAPTSTSRRKWRRNSEAVVSLLETLLRQWPEAERRQMFGCPCAFLQGNMFLAAHEDRLILRLPEEERARLLGQPGIAPFVANGRRMREYVAVDLLRHEDVDELSDWANRAYRYAGALPPKARERKRGRG